MAVSRTLPCFQHYLLPRWASFLRRPCSNDFCDSLLRPRQDGQLFKLRTNNNQITSKYSFQHSTFPRPDLSKKVRFNVIGAIVSGQIENRLSLGHKAVELWLCHFLKYQCSLYSLKTNVSDFQADLVHSFAIVASVDHLISSIDNGVMLLSRLFLGCDVLHHLE